MPWIDEVWIRSDVEKSLVWKKHLNLCNICIRILSNVTLVKIFSSLNRDYFRWGMISLNHISFQWFRKNTLVLFYVGIFWLSHCVVCVWGGQPLEQDCQDGVPSRVGQGLNPLSLFPHLSKRTVRVVTSWDFGSSENFGLDDARKACIPHTPRWDSRPWTSEDFTVVCL